MMSRSEICAEFKIDNFDGAVVFANYVQESYEGEACVLFVDDGKLYMVSGSHCSCNGLEGQWDPDEITIDMLRKMASAPAKWDGTDHLDTQAAKHALNLLDKLREPDPVALQAALALTK